MKLELKYQPKTFDEIIIPNKKEIIDKIKDLFSKSNTNTNTKCMRLLIYGNHDVCKTLLSNIIVEEYYKYYNIKQNNKLVYNYNVLSDLVLINGNNNELQTFCQNQTLHKKFVILDSFDMMNESNQQYIKGLVDTFINRVHFIVITNNIKKCNDIIRSRFQDIEMKNMDEEIIKQIMLNIMKKENIDYDESSLNDFINENRNKSIMFFINTLNKIIILNTRSFLKEFTDNEKGLSYQHIKYYFEEIKNKNLQKANKILLNLYDIGYDISDIYFYINSFLKDKIDKSTTDFKVFNIICKYIDLYYDGYYSKSVLLFFSNEILENYNKKNNE